MTAEHTAATTAGLPPSTAAEGEVVWTLEDAGHELAGVRLWQELGLPGNLLDFDRVEGGWRLRLPPPPVRRLQYLFEVRRPDGSVELHVDPRNPARAGGPFGEHSVLELPGYAPPRWLQAQVVDGGLQHLSVPARTLAGDVPVSVWSPAGVAADVALPLLLAHDGYEMDAYAGLTRYVAAELAAERLPPMRVALLGPGQRNAWYSASPAYARCLVHSVLPAVAAACAITGRPALAGASLGGLAALHAAWRSPGTFGGLFLQSGSFFALPTDAHEIRFSGFWRVAGFVDTVMTARPPGRLPPVAMTCGAVEENADNNRALAARLRGLGAEVDLVETADVHTWTAWRDALDPALTDLLARLWGGVRGP